MRKLYCVLFVCGLLLASPVFAQEESGWDKHVFGFVGGGKDIDYANFFRLGGGVEAISPIGAGFVIDLGYLQYTPSGYGFVSLSAAAVYQFPLRGELRPYARGGLGYIADTEGEGGAAVWNVGGGINYWFHERGGLKVEVRDTWGQSYFYSGLIEVTVGLMYRF